MTERTGRPYYAVLLLICALLGGAPRGHGAGPGKAIGLPHELSADHPPGSTFMGLRLLGTLRLDAVRLDGGHALHSLSALGYDEDADRLYALSDRGVLFHLRLEFDHGLLTQAYALAAHPLLDERGRRLRGSRADAEGMALRNARNGIAGDTEVLISFERRPRIVRYDVRGTPTGTLALPRALADPLAYRDGNKGLEAVTVHPRHGILAGAEQPMLNAPQDQVQVHAIERGYIWSYPLPAEPNHALVALEALPDGRLLILERAHGFLYVPFITLLREFPPPPPRSAQLGEGRVAVRLSTGHGFALDNFEGFTRHRGRRFLMVSDDNGKPFQVTLLSYFELMDAGAKAGAMQDTTSDSAR